MTYAYGHIMCQIQNICCIGSLTFLLVVAGISADLPEYDHGLGGISSTQPLNIAHRGSSGMYPENTQESVQLAIDQGADMIEIDLCLTKDLHLICLHESWCGSKTNIADIFPEDRMNTYFVQGRNITDYFSVDFTLEELKQIGVKQSRSYRDPNYDFQFEIATVEEYIQTIQSADRTVGLLVELKDTAWVNSLDIVKDANTSIEDLTIGLLHEYGYFGINDSVIVQSFQENSIQYVAERTEFPVSFLSSAPLSDSTLERLSTYCYSIGVTKELIILVNSQDQRTGVSDLVERAHSFGLRVNVWTARNEDEFLVWDYGQDPFMEYEDFVLNALVDGVITDFPATYNRYIDYSLMLQQHRA